MPSLPHSVGVETVSAMTGEGGWCGHDSEGSMDVACGQARGGTTTRSCPFGDFQNLKSCNAVMESGFDFIVVGGRCLPLIHRIEFRTHAIQLEHRALCLPRV
jgi:hypothetical protein